MGIKDFIKGQLIDVIQFTTDDKDILAHKFEDMGKQIMMGAQLTVRPGQKVVFINEGEIADVFDEGRYELTTSNMPVLTKIKSWKYGFESPFKVDIYFISVDEKIGQTWGTPSKIIIKDPDFGMLRIGSNAYYNYKVVDPGMFISKLVGTDSEFKVAECRQHLNGQFTTSFTDFFAEAKTTLFNAYAHIKEFSDDVKLDVAPKFLDFGLELISFDIQEIKVPEVVESALDERATIAALGGMDMYQRKTITDATAEAAVNMSQREGGSGIAGMGMEVATGMSMGSMMGGMMGGMMGNNNQSQPNNNQSAPPSQSMATCPHCQSQVDPNAKFCSNCGKTMAPPTGKACVACHAQIAKDAKFCPECGTKQVEAAGFCSECGAENPAGTKFCSSCGKQQ